MNRSTKADTPPKNATHQAGSPRAPANRKHGMSDTAPYPIQPEHDDASWRDPDIRYKNPPRKGQWPKGRSGNKTGRKKGSKNKKTVIIEMMEAKLGRKIPDPKKMTRYEGMMFKAIQKALGGCIRSMGFVLAEYRKAIEASGPAGTTTNEEDEQAYKWLCDKIRDEIEKDIRASLRAEIHQELTQDLGR